MGKPIDVQKIIKLLPSIPIGTKLFLRKDALPEAKLREFRFEGQGKDHNILLIPESNEYDWEAKIEMIDWERFLEENPNLAESVSAKP